MFWINYWMLMIGTPCIYCFLWKAIQHGEMFGAWQKVIDAVYAKNKNWADFLGNCEVCFAHFVAWICMICFIAISWNIWPFEWYISIVFVPVHVAVLWWLGRLAKLVTDRKQHEAYIKEKEAEYLKQQETE